MFKEAQAEKSFQASLAELKQLSDQGLTSFVDREKLLIQGHIVAEDIGIVYSFSGEKIMELSEKYDTTPIEEM